MNIEAEIAAIQFTLLAIINTRPNKKELLAEFDALFHGIQVGLIASGSEQLTPEPIREALSRFRTQMAENVD